MKKVSLNHLLILIVSLAVVIRFYALGLRPFDGDEGVVIKIVSGSLADLWNNFAIDVHPPLHHFLTWIPISLFGISEVSARLVPAILGALLPVAVYFLTRDFINRQTAYLAAILTAISPYLLYFSQENRMYSLFIFLAVLTLWQWLTYLKNGQLKNLKLWIGLAFLAALTLHLGLFVGLIQVLIALVYRKQYKHIFAFIAVAIVAYSPLALKTYQQFTGRLQEQSVFSLVDNLSGVINAIYRFIPGRTFLSLETSPTYYFDWLNRDFGNFAYFVLTLILPLGLFAYGLFIVVKKYRDLIPMIILAAALFILAMISSEIGPRATRFLSLLAPVYYIIVALGLISLNKTFRMLMFILLAFIMLNGIFIHYNRDSKAVGQRQVAEFLDSHAQSEDSVVVRGAFLGGETLVLDYYREKFPKQPDYKIVDYYSDYQPGNLESLRKRTSREIIEQALLDHNRVWYYDLTYQNEIKGDEFYSLGRDKENQEILIHEFIR